MEPEKAKQQDDAKRFDLMIDQADNIVKRLLEHAKDLHVFNNQLLGPTTNAEPQKGGDEPHGRADQMAEALHDLDRGVDMLGAEVARLRGF